MCIRDRFLLDAVADQLWLVADGGVSEYTDDLNGYRKWLTNRKRHPVQDDPVDGKPAQNQADKSVTPDTTSTNADAAIAHDASSQAADTPAAPILDAAARKQQKRDQAMRRQQLAPLKKRMDAAEKNHQELQQQLDSLQQKLGDNDLYTGERQSEVTDLLKTRKELEDQLQVAEDDWLDACQQYEDAETG